MTIGLIDDDLTYKFLTRTLISKVSPTTKIIELSDGQEAIEFLNSNADLSHLPDVILLDINMPRLNGWQFLDQLRISNIPLYHPVIYMVSSSIDMEDIANAKVYEEITRYIPKPILMNVLREIITDANTGLSVDLA